MIRNYAIYCTAVSINQLRNLMKKRTLLIGILLLLAATAAFAVGPNLLSYQGQVLTAGGAPVVNGAYPAIFTFYPVAVAGSPLWSESGSITTSAGLFTHNLGIITAIPTSVFTANANVWLEVTVNGELQTPRTQMTSAGNAIAVSTVDGASGGTITSSVSIGTGHTNLGGAGLVAGNNNTVTGSYSSVCGGQFNAATGTFATIGGGTLDTASGSRSTIGGGEANQASANWSTVSGGRLNAATGVSATVGGGTLDTATGGGATISGGFNNNARAQDATVGGGNNNTASGIFSTVGGGTNNIASGDTLAGLGGSATVAGGSSNEATGNYSSVGGGFANIASGRQATAPGGRGNRAIGNISFAAGSRASASHLGTFVWADSSADVAFTSTAINQFLIRAEGGVGIGTNAPAHPLHMASGAHVTTGGVWTNASSRELKFDIEPLKYDEYTDFLTKLEDIQIVHFKYKSEPDVDHIGMIAEDVPDEMASPDRKGIPTADAIAFLIAAVKAQQSQIKELQATVKELKKDK
jgi:trimeric autotransporter adhesin